MVGYVTEAVAKALNEWDALKVENIITVRATAGQSVVVDTPLPAIALQLVGVEGEGNTFLGGGIRQYFELYIAMLIPVTNYTFSPDNGEQAEQLDLSDEIIRCIELTTLLDEVKQKHDLNLQFDRMQTDTTFATAGTYQMPCDVHTIVYNGSVHFDPRDEAFKRYALLKKVIADNGVNKTVIE